MFIVERQTLFADIRKMVWTYPGTCVGEMYSSDNIGYSMAYLAIVIHTIVIFVTSCLVMIYMVVCLHTRMSI
jgi:hypothetical protein